jgi:hypothetical protein
MGIKSRDRQYRAPLNCAASDGNIVKQAAWFSDARDIAVQVKLDHSLTIPVVPVGGGRDG